MNGDFKRGYAVSVAAENGEEIGRGIARYSSEELSQITGYQSHQISARLGYDYGPVVIHRDDLIIL